MACFERLEKNYVDLVCLAINASLFFYFDVFNHHCFVERGIEKRRTTAV